jgi:hypothetical protein
MMNGLWRKICLNTPFIILIAIALFMIWQGEKPVPVRNNMPQFVPVSSSSSEKKYTSDEKRIANHFSADTLPGLMQKGLIQTYRRNESGTFISVIGKLWRCRSEYFKHSFLTEVYIYNKFNDYGLSTMVLDSLSGKLHAQISPSGKIDIYD